MIEIEEGELLKQPPSNKPKRKQPVKKAKRKKQPPPKPRIRFILDPKPKPPKEKVEIPGYGEWLSRRTKENFKYRDHGRQLGFCDGINPRMMKKLLAEAKIKAQEDLAKIEAATGPIEDDAAREALTGALEVLRTPVNQQTKLAAARLLLDFTKAKPASKSEVTVNAAEAWLESLGDK